VTASSQPPINAVVAIPLTTSPETLAANDGRRTPSAGSTVIPFSGLASMAVHSRCQSERPVAVTFPQAMPGTLTTMAGPGELDSARLRRDLSLVLRRRLTFYPPV
jgi:hypothetical protein